MIIFNQYDGMAFVFWREVVFFILFPYFAHEKNKENFYGFHDMSF